jgi:EAL and modified HD-GYP domain-containing signal transduction protein
MEKMARAAELTTTSSTEVSQQVEGASPQNEIFIARQPIFNRETKVFAYELLFRSSNISTARVEDGSKASSQVILNAFVDMCIREIAENRQVFVNFTRDFLVGDIPLPLSPKSLVVEILEDVKIDEPVVNGLQKLARKGYTLALDDYLFSDDKGQLFDIIDIVKIDLLGCEIGKMEEQIIALKKKGLRLLAEKVETQEEFELCKRMGFDYFQGFFFSKPTILSGQSVKPNRLAVLQTIAQLQDPDCDITELEKLIRTDVGISYKLLRIINSAFYNFRREIKSVREAIVALGLQTIRDWMSIIVMTDIDDKPLELISLSLQRARMMQTLCGKTGYNEETGFITGMFSAIDAMMDQPMEEILRQLPLADEIVDALVRREGAYGEVLETIEQYEHGDWDSVVMGNLSNEDVIDSYIESISWTSQLFSQLAE